MSIHVSALSRSRGTPRTLLSGTPIQPTHVQIVGLTQALRKQEIILDKDNAQVRIKSSDSCLCCLMELEGENDQDLVLTFFDPKSGRPYNFSNIPIELEYTSDFGCDMGNPSPTRGVGRGNSIVFQNYDSINHFQFRFRLDTPQYHQWRRVTSDFQFGMNQQPSKDELRVIVGFLNGGYIAPHNATHLDRFNGCPSLAPYVQVEEEPLDSEYDRVKFLLKFNGTDP